MAKVFDELVECGMEGRNCEVMMVRVTTPGTVSAAAQRQGWS